LQSGVFIFALNFHRTGVDMGSLLINVKRFVKGILGIAVVAVVLAGGGGLALAATPAAGTNIGNQASASYTDASGVSRSVTSNVVTAVVQQVASLTLGQNTAKSVVAGGQVVYPLTLTNTGNGTDTFSLTSAQAGGFSFTNVTFYADANGDGVADNSTPITVTTPLAQGEVFRFVAVATVPTSAAAAAVNTLTISATSAFASGVSANTTETTTVTSNAVINVTKSMSAASGAPGSNDYVVTLNYSNTGNSPATNVTLRDLLPAGMLYVPGSGRWSATGATALTDSNDGTQGAAPNTIAYEYGVTPLQVSAVIGTVSPGSSGILSFRVNIAAFDTVTATGQLAGVLNNTANYTYGDGSGATIGPVNSNVFAFTVNAVNATTMSGATVASAAQGSTVAFNNVVRNNGNTTDTFEITIGSNIFPAGTTFALYKSDGVTPMLDTNSNGTPDTGPLASGVSYTVVLKATLPTGSTGGPYTVSKTATSKLDPTKSATVVDTLTAIAPNSVDLTNNTATGAGVPGAGVFAAGEAAAQVTNTANPGATTRFTLYVNNTTAGVADTFDLSMHSALPAGWSVVFRNAAGAVITNSGVVNGGANVLVFADVTIPASQAAIPAGQDLFFKVLSPTSGATDVIRDAVVVNTVRNVTLSPSNTGQVFPGGSIVYSHALSNLGNVTESNIALATADSQGTFSSIIYVDVNNNGILDSADTVTSTIASLSQGASLNLLVKVSAVSGAAVGALDVTTLSATTSGTTNGVAAPVVLAATDSSTVIAGNLVLVKEQALDATCAGAGPFTYSTANITTGAVPGACIRYRITVTNMGTADAVNVVLSDATPSNTTYSATVPASTTAGTMNALPADGTAGTISTSTATGFTLAPSASAVMTFGVRINQ
jgi:trimeric autotransporter adhesin